MATVTIGGTTYQVGELNFIAMERAWPFIADAMLSQDPIGAVGAALSVIAAGIMEEDYFKEEDFDIRDDLIQPFMDREPQVLDQVTKFLKRKCKATEIENVRQALTEITKEAGLAPEEGEAVLKLLEETRSSTETSTTSSPSSSPQELKEEVGTE